MRIPKVWPRWLKRRARARAYLLISPQNETLVCKSYIDILLTRKIFTMWSIKLQVNFSDFMAYHTGFSKRELLDLNSFQATLGLESGPVLALAFASPKGSRVLRSTCSDFFFTKNSHNKLSKFKTPLIRPLITCN